MKRVIFIFLTLLLFAEYIFSQSTPEDAINFAVNFPKFNQDNIDESIGNDFYVDPFSGALVISQKDLHLPGRNGLNIDLIRHYNSKAVTYWGSINEPRSEQNKKIKNSGLGLGWHLSFPRYDDTIPDKDYISVIWSDGSIKKVIHNGEDTYTQDFTRVIQIGSAPNEYYILREKGGIEYTLKETSAESRLWVTEKVQDLWGNYITIEYYDNSQYIKKITDTMGREIFFYRDSDDFDNGRYTIIKYAVDSQSTDTITVRFSYNADKQLVGVQQEKHGGTVIWKNEFIYDNDYYFEIVKVKYATGGSVKFQYYSDNIYLVPYEQGNFSQYTRLVQNYRHRDGDNSIINTFTYDYTQNDDDNPLENHEADIYWIWTVVSDSVGQNDAVYRFEAPQKMLWSKSGILREKWICQGRWDSGIIIKMIYRTYEVFRIGETTDDGDEGYVCWVQSEGNTDWDENGENPKSKAVLYRNQVKLNYGTVFQGETNGYDQFGNTERIYELGEVTNLSATYNTVYPRYDKLNYSNTTGDERKIYRDYLHEHPVYGNDYIAMNIINKVTLEKITEDNETTVKRTDYLYDTQTTFTSYSPLPVNRDPVSINRNGKLNRIDRWDPDRSPSSTTTEFKYDVCGNVVQKIDENQKNTYYYYKYEEGAYDKYQYAYLNKTKQTVNGTDIINRYEYNFHTGDVTEGIDPNNRTKQFVYDEKSRLHKVIEPGDTESYPTLEYIYTDYINNPGKHWRVEVLRKKNAANEYYAPVWYFYDGLGRLIQTQQTTGDTTSEQLIESVSTWAAYGEPDNYSSRVVNLDEGDYNVRYDLDNDGNAGYTEFWFDYGSTPSSPYLMYEINTNAGRLFGTEMFELTANTYCMKVHAVFTGYKDVGDIYTAEGYIYRINYPSMIITDIQYDEMGRKKRVSNPRYHTPLHDHGDYQIPNWQSIDYTEYAYDALSRAKNTIFPDAATISNEYGSNSMIRTDEVGVKKKVIKDIYGNTVEAISDFGGTNPGSTSTLYEYDILGQLIEFTRPEGDVAQLQYNKLGQLIYTNSPSDAGSVSMHYDKKGQLRFIQDQKQANSPDGSPRFHYIKYNEAGRKISEGYVIDDLYFTQTYADVADFPNDSSPGSNNYSEKATYTYDTYAGQSTPPGVNTNNPLGNLTKVTDESGYTQYFYDDRGRISEQYIIINGLSGKLTEYEYNKQGQTTQITYPNDSTVTNNYNTLGQLTGIPGYINSMAYNASGNVTNIAFNNGRSNSYTYNNRNWATSMNLGNAETNWDYGYRANGNLEWEERGSVQIPIDYTYDGLNRLKSVDYPGGEPGDDRTYTYDDNGNRIGMNSAVYYYHTGTNRMKDVKDVASQVDYQYDAAGNLINDFRKGRKYQYDWANRLMEVDDYFYTWYLPHSSEEEANFRVESEWLKFKARDNTGGKYAKKAIDTIPLTGSGTINYSFRFTRANYEDMDYFRVHLQDSTDGAGFVFYFYRRGSQRVIAYTWSPETLGTTIFEEYYFGLENGTHTVEFEVDLFEGKVYFYLNEGSTPFRYGSANLDPNITEVNTIKIYHAEASFNYDDFNVSKGSTIVYQDHFDGPVTDSRPRVEMVYNAAGRRVSKKSPDWDVRYIMAQGQIMAVYENIGGTWTHKQNFIFGNGRRLAMWNASNSSPYYYYSDYLGSVREFARQNQSYVYRRDYYPFGQDRNASGGWNPEHYKFTGKAQDGETGLYYFGARYYDPELGRWTQVDPLWGKYPGLSPYSYAAGNPLWYIDPDGKKIVDPQKHNIGNVGLISVIKEFDAAVAQVLGVPSSGFKLVISGGDRYRDEQGNIRSRTTKEIVSESDPKSPHLVERGARAVDFSGTESDKRITSAVLEKTKNIVNKGKDKESPINQIKIYKDSDGHIHISISDKASGKYDRNLKPFEEEYVSPVLEIENQ